MPAVLRDSGRHEAREDLLPRGLPALAAGTSAHRAVQRWVSERRGSASDVALTASFSAAAGDISAAVETLRSLLLFYPSDKDSLDNLQLYSETLEGATETPPIQVSADTPLFSHQKPRGVRPRVDGFLTFGHATDAVAWFLSSRRSSATSVNPWRRRSCSTLERRTLTSVSLTP